MIGFDDGLLYLKFLVHSLNLLSSVKLLFEDLVPIP